jgi:four helix bundle protein
VGESFRDLRVWQRAVDLSVAVYDLTDRFPRKEVFGISNQLRRASVSVSSNIAEGYGRGTTRDYVHFLSIARGSNSEVQTQLVIARRLHFGVEQDLDKAEALSHEVGKMLNALMKSLRGAEKRG